VVVPGPVRDWVQKELWRFILKEGTLLSKVPGGEGPIELEVIEPSTSHVESFEKNSIFWEAIYSSLKVCTVRKFKCQALCI
jgi:hypothetical protein